MIRIANKEVLAYEHYKLLKKSVLAKAFTECKPIYNFLSKDDNKNLKIILQGSIEEIISLNVSNKGFFLRHRKKAISIFNYRAFCSKKKGYDAYDLAENLQVNICPYCNRQYTFTIKAEMRPEFDHFLSKDAYPQFSLSFYNLIPSCHSCNHKKSTHDTISLPLINPYTESFDNIRFSTEIKSVDAIIGKNSKDVNIKFRFMEKDLHQLTEHERKALTSIKVFSLDKIYKFHSDYAHEIIQKAYFYSDSWVQEIYESFPILFNNKEEINRLVFGNYIQIEDLGKRPLSKLTRDILLELAIIQEI